MKKNIRYFSLIEMIVVVVVLGIVSSIVIPNIKDVRSKAEVTYLQTSQKNIQTAVDMYKLENFDLPVQGSEQPTLGKPKKLDFGKLKYDFLRDDLTAWEYYCWVDYLGVVSISKVDAPIDFTKNRSGLVWKSDEKVQAYKIYEIVSADTLSYSNKTTLKLLDVVENTNSYCPPDYNQDKEYAISAVDTYGNGTPEVVEGYVGYEEDSDIKPTAVIGMNISAGIDTKTNVAFYSTDSNDPDGDNIIAEEWTLDDNEPTATPPNGLFTEGNHTVSLRVQDEHGLWSDWVSKTFEVQHFNQKPTAVIKRNISGEVDTDTYLVFDSNSSSDPDGDNIVAKEWTLDGKSPTTTPPNGLFSEGSHTVSLRVQDEHGLWSDWVSQTFSVKVIKFSTATFTSGSASGRYGPTQAQLNTTYSGTPLAGQVTSSNGVQLWSVPKTGTYRIEVYGAVGGNSHSNYIAGKGARMRGDFYLTKGTLLNIVVGQRGQTGAGGGGSFVWINNSNTPLIVAGGGGGAAGHPTSGYSSNGIDATTSQNGMSAGSATGGINGRAGTAGATGAPSNGLNGSGGGGSGWSEDANGGFFKEDEKALKRGGRGGSGGGGHGGFGGGGSGWFGGGGGGGYSGGAGGTWCVPTGGGGGGSYNAGTNQSNSSGANSGDGKVIFSFIQ